MTCVAYSLKIWVHAFSATSLVLFSEGDYIDEHPHHILLTKVEKFKL